MSKATREPFSSHVSSALKNKFIEISDERNISRSKLLDEALALLINEYDKKDREELIISPEVNELVKELTDKLKVMYGSYISKKRIMLPILTSELEELYEKFSTITSYTWHTESVKHAGLYSQDVISTIINELVDSPSEICADSNIILADIESVWSVVNSIHKAIPIIYEIANKILPKPIVINSIRDLNVYMNKMLKLDIRHDTLNYIYDVTYALTHDINALSSIDWNSCKDNEVPTNLDLFTRSINEDDIIQYYNMKSQSEPESHMNLTAKRGAGKTMTLNDLKKELSHMQERIILIESFAEKLTDDDFK